MDADGSNERRLVTVEEIQQYAIEILEIDWHPAANRILALVRGSGTGIGGRIYDLDLDLANSWEKGIRSKPRWGTCEIYFVPRFR